MSAPMIVFAFLVIVFSPCLLAYVAWCVGDADAADDRFAAEGRTLPRMGRKPLPLQAGLPERPIGNDFEIRSFPKGLSQRRFVVRDAENAPRLTITQVREAAVELAKLGGFIVAHELALIAAAMVAAGKSVAAAAREAIEAAHNLFARQTWVNAGPARSSDEAWDQGPPRFGPATTRAVWHEETVAA